MSSQRTVTLTLNKLQLEMIVCCVKRCLPQTPLKLSVTPAVNCCPNCSAVLTQCSDFCSECVQCIDWQVEEQWADQMVKVLQA